VNRPRKNNASEPIEPSPVPHLSLSPVLMLVHEKQGGSRSMELSRSGGKTIAACFVIGDAAKESSAGLLNARWGYDEAEDWGLYGRSNAAMRLSSSCR
jgi:hypothetical protein